MGIEMRTDAKSFEDLMTDIASLEGRVKVLYEENKELKSSYETVNKMRKDNYYRVIELEKENNTLKNDLDSRDEEISRLTEENEKLKSDCNVWKHNWKIADGLRKENNNHVLELMKENEKLKEDYEQKTSISFGKERHIYSLERDLEEYEKLWEQSIKEKRAVEENFENFCRQLKCMVDLIIEDKFSDPK